MASTSASGIACAALTAALAASTTLSAGPIRAQPPSAIVTVEIEGLRDAKGVVRLCLTARRDDFPDCKKGGAMSGTVRASKGVARYVFTNVAPGTYAIATFHDANGDAKLNTSLGIPREGFAFSRNPPIRPRAPRFDETSVKVGGDTALRLRMRYLL